MQTLVDQKVLKGLDFYAFVMVFEHNSKIEKKVRKKILNLF